MKSSPKHLIASAKNGDRKAKAFIIAVLALAVISMIVVTAVTTLRDTSGTVTEELTQAEVTCSVNSDRSVKNTGNIPALIRVRVVVNKTADGEIIPGDTPAFSAASDWTLIDDYYYYNAIVSCEDGENDTTVPITFSDTVEDDVEVLVLAEAIQAAADAAEESWGVSFSNGSWS